MRDRPGQMVAAVNDVATDEPVGERPYEMIWARRREDRKPLLDFQDLAGWTVACYRGARAELRRSRKQRLWGECVGEVTFSGTSDQSAFMLRPAAPIPIPGRFDCINFWVYGNNIAWEPPDPNNPQVEMLVHLRDARGRTFGVSLGIVRWKEWWLVHRRLIPLIPFAATKDLECYPTWIRSPAPGRLSFPCALAGLEIRGCTNTVPSVLFLSSLYFYTEAFARLRFGPRPRRNIRPRPGQNVGLNKGPGVLPFPTRPETILPSNFERRFVNRVEQRSGGEFTFVYEGQDTRIRYEYVPRAGSLGEIRAFVDDREIGRPLAEGGLKFDGKDAVEKMTCRSARVASGVLSAVFHSRRGRATSRLWIWQKSLVIETTCRGGRASELSLGHADGVAQPRLIRVPFLVLGLNDRLFDQQVLMVQGQTPVFLFAMADWYHSNASELFVESWVNARSARFQGGVKYLPKTDGRRNDLFERVFLTVSPRFEEVLPTVANPSSPHGRTVGAYLWQSTGPQNYDDEHRRSRMLRSYGIEKLIQCSHEVTWRDGCESYTLRTRAAPRRGGDAGLRKFARDQKALGWRFGLYTNYTDLAPVNAFWNEDHVIRIPTGEWRPAWVRCYALKPARAVELEARLAPRIKRKFRPTAGYTDVHTCVYPWHYLDYDARVPGAGTFAATYYAYGELLLDEQKVIGPVFSEGPNHMFYAGLLTGNYGWGPYSKPTVDFYVEPLQVAFDLLKLHPLECDFGIGATGRHFGPREDRRYADEHIDRFIAATLAYGHIGWLVEESHGIRQMCRSYYMIQQVSKRYALRPVRDIAYADGDNRWLTPSQAIATGALAESRLRVEYGPGLTVFVNWSRDRAWPLLPAWTQATGRTLVLPPSGWCAFDRRGFLTASHVQDGRRLDETIAADYIYMDGRDHWTRNGHLAAAGGVVRRTKRRGRDRVIEITDLGDNQTIGVRTAQPARACRAYDDQGACRGEVAVDYQDGYTLLTTSGARSYELVE